jgi:flagellar biosynthesis protein FlhB
MFQERTILGAVEFKYVVIVILVLILGSLGKALFHLSSSKPGEEAKMVTALAWRVGLSVLLFLLLFVAYDRGWIDPLHGPH